MFPIEYEPKIAAIHNSILSRLNADRDRIALTQQKLESIDTQLESWKRMPKEQALKEAVALFKAYGMEPTEVRTKLEVLKFIAEIQGVFVAQQNAGNNIVAIKFVMPETSALKPVIDITHES